MSQNLKNKLKFRLKTVHGILLKAPMRIAEQNIDFLLIVADVVEYHILGGRKTFRMWNLVDTHVQITGVLKKSSEYPRVSVITYKCIDDFLNLDTVPISQWDEKDFEPSRLDYAI